VVFRKFPIQVVQAKRLAQARLDPRARGSASTRFYEIKSILREHRLHTVCEEASCPNIGECFGKGTATFMIMGDKCTRRCLLRRRARPPGTARRRRTAQSRAHDRGAEACVRRITSVDRDDLRDGGAAHFVQCIRTVRELSPATRIEVLGRISAPARPRARSARSGAADVMNITGTCRGFIGRRDPAPTMPIRCACCRSSSGASRTSRPRAG